MLGHAAINDAACGDGHAAVAQAWTRDERPATSPANSLGSARGSQWPASTSTVVRSRQRASRPVERRAGSPRRRGWRRAAGPGATYATGPGSRRRGSDVGAVEVDAVPRRSAATSRPQGSRLDGRVERRRSAGGAATGRGARPARGATAPGRARRTSCARTCGSSRSRPRQTWSRLPRWSSGRSADRGVRRHPALEARVPGLGGDDVPAGDRAPVVRRRGAPARPRGGWRRARR